MQLGATIGAVAGALIGAVLWALISITTGYEIGYAAWGVGLLVGLGAHYCGGSGQTLAITCGVLALVAILTGKIMSVNHYINSDVSEYAQSAFTYDMYQEVLEDAKVLKDTPPENYRQFMVERQYSEAVSPQMVSEEELQEFTFYQVPYLEEIDVTRPDYQVWHEQRMQEVEGFATSIPLSERLSATLGFLDILFVFFGVTTAYRVALGGSDD